VAHMGDIGHTLTDAQLEETGDIDVLMVPCGGHSTVDAAGAYAIVQQLNPKIVVPMHYKTDKIDGRIDGVEPFEKLFDHVEHHTGPLEFTSDSLPKQTTLMVMTPLY